MKPACHGSLLFAAALVCALAPVRVAAAAPASTAELHLPAFPLPALVSDGGPPREMSSMRLLRELHRGGVHGAGNFEAADADYALLRGDTLGGLAAWLEAACTAVGFDLLRARAPARSYDGTTFARLLSVSTSIAALRQKGIRLAMPIGVVVCARQAAWGELPADGKTDAYVAFVTEDGMMVYDPPTRQLVTLGDFPNKKHILRIRF